MGVSHNFEDLERDIEDLKARTAGISDSTSKKMGEQMKEEVVNILSKETSATGSSFDSRTSKYEPGDPRTNESASSKTADIHLTETQDSKSAWKVTKQSAGQNGGSRYLFSVKPDAAGRASAINDGTVGEDITPKRGTPMYFYASGNLVIVSPVDPDAPPRARFKRIRESVKDTLPSVRGIESVGYLERGIDRVRPQVRYMGRKELRKAVQEIPNSTLENS